MIHSQIADFLEETLQEALIDGVLSDDDARAGVILQGPLQGDPDPDAARISVTIHENDPDVVYKSGTSGMSDAWEDEVAEIECGGSITMKRRFTVKARCLLVDTAESLSDARRIAATVRSRIEAALINANFNGLSDESGEFVSKGVLSEGIKGEMIQAGGPGSYDYHIKFRFQVETTKGVTP